MRRQAVINKFRRSAILVFALVVGSLLIFSQSPVAYSLSPAQKKLFDSGVRYFNIDACAPTSSAAPATSASGGIYMVGDSITVRSKNELESALNKNGSVYINGSVSRSITQPGIDAGYKTSGLEAVEGDSARVKNAGTVIVALGTNQRDGNFKAAISNMVKRIRAINDGASIFWVNTFSEDINKKEINSAIEEQAEKLDFKVIDASTVDIELDPDGLHQTVGKGSKAFAVAVEDGLNGGDSSSSSAPTNGNLCSCGSAAGENLTGSGNEEKIFNYLVGRGLQPHQAAGIMGNMKAESGFNPKALEPGTTGDFPIEGRGYGLVQWTFSERQAPLIKKARDSGREVYDLQLQLEYVFDELEGPFKEVYEKLKAAKDYKEATLIIELGYEIHAGGIQTERQDTARDVLGKYGSGASGGSGGSAASACGSDINGELVGEFSLPVEKKYYVSNPEWFTKPHHDYPSADIPVGTGTKIFSVAAGKVSSMSNANSDTRGVHVEVTSGDIVYKYFHGTPGSVKVSMGAEVKPGRLLMLTDNTGRSEGPHLHFQIDIKGVKHCPQKLLDAIGKGGNLPRLEDLPTSGCTN